MKTTIGDFNRLALAICLSVVLVFQQSCFALKWKIQHDRKKLYSGQVSGTGKETIHYTYDGHVIVNAKLNDNKYHKLIVDNGGYSELANSIATSLGFKQVSYLSAYDAMHNVVYFPVYKGGILGLDSHLYKDFGYSGMDISKIGAKKCAGVEGVLGINILETGVWTFDHQNRVITIENENKHLPGNATKVRLVKKGNHHYLKLKINGIIVEAVLDLGYNGSISMPKAFVPMPASEQVYQFYGLTSKTNSYSYYDTMVYVQQIDATILNTSLPVHFRFANLSARNYAIIGNRILEEYNLTLDLKHNIAYFLPVNDRVDRANYFVKNGCSIDMIDTAWQITTLMAGGKAERLGINIGDQVLKINSHSLVTLSDCDVYQVLDAAFTSDIPIDMKLRRDSIGFNVLLVK